MYRSALDSILRQWSDDIPGATRVAESRGEGAQLQFVLLP